ncbi:cytochrome b-c1 complex subunit 7 [Strongylocentrotus purpuratus]|uniref:Cytochrome b-c1 complex subunit 7 n=1 Tax=Strongylocentrotus purpuratus TaxID=7668 RepID=A0A7M7RFP9_STRPU|nr:cytochrome b-c1 complex subunit 7 [Strongylocentrotus purpuratus]|eukprot:XP_790701.3 PREDICTED: cytochrome b-c1 complex subunit 7 [Strongylocentrotus purpuratus]
MSVATKSTPLFGGFRKWYYSLCGFNQLGLRRDDTLRSNPIVEEAIRRLPENEYNDRVFRIKRALDLSLKHSILPKDQWTKFEEDSRYLKPFLDEVEKEFTEKAEWNKR